MRNMLDFYTSLTGKRIKNKAKCCHFLPGQVNSDKFIVVLFQVYADAIFVSGKAGDMLSL